MKAIKLTTRAGRRFVEMYKASNYQSVMDAYKAPSSAKIKAEALCFDLMIREGGSGYKVISFNTFQFSAAWMTLKGLRVETPTNSILVTL